jgi:hypothetical protein
MTDFGTIDIYVYKIDLISHREELQVNLIRSIRKSENSLCYIDLEILGFGNIIISFFPIFTDIGTNLIKSKYIRQYPFFITKIKKYSFFYEKGKDYKDEYSSYGNHKFQVELQRIYFINDAYEALEQMIDMVISDNEFWK